MSQSPVPVLVRPDRTTGIERATQATLRTRPGRASAPTLAPMFRSTFTGKRPSRA